MHTIKEIGVVVISGLFVAFFVWGATFGWLAMLDKKFSKEGYIIVCAVSMNAETSNGMPVAVLLFPTEGFAKCADDKVTYKVKTY